MQRLEAEKPEFFGFLLMAAYLAYYATPPVIEAIRLDGHIYNDAPQPLGYDLKPFSFTPGLDLPLVPRGSFKWTFDDGTDRSSPAWPISICRPGGSARERASIRWMW